ncbi:hypothetical protein [Pseudoalteromonas prydzensis]|uniref:hypothetical protein n=1 Tax=Pseudoalteromonas prydzensis TaxID=182141 RepID=UPI003FD008B6
MKATIYKTLVHKPHGTLLAFVCASSKVRVAEILNTSVGQLRNYGCNLLSSNDQYFSKYKDLKDGDVAYEDANKTQPKSGISMIDLHRIAAIGYIDAALQSLNQCEMPTREMSNRLADLRGELQELKSDARESIEKKYSGR